MSDLISRQAAVDAVKASASKYKGFMEMEMYTDDDAVEAINGVPSADAVPVDDLCEKINEAHNEGYDVGYWAGRRDYEPKWIPVAERLPEEWKPVLGLIRFCDEEEPPAQQVLWYLGNGHWRETWRGDMIESAVTHWMPLPDPPKGERKDDDEE